MTFRKKLFPDPNEETLLLLADRKGAPPGTFRWCDFSHAGELAKFYAPRKKPLPTAETLDADALISGEGRLIEYFLPRKVRELYRELGRLPSTRRLGELADVGIGYVTGGKGV